MSTERPLRPPPLRRSLRPAFFGFIFALMLYVLSAGPAWWLLSKDVIASSTYWKVYDPIAFLDKSPGDIFYKYINWWASVAEVNHARFAANDRR